MLCYCCSDSPYSDCCEPFISGGALPDTAEQLMRSRYTAYATYNAIYLEETVTGPARSPEPIVTPPHCWVSLEIISCTQGLASDTSGTVEFKASYEEDAVLYTMHEISQFEKINNRWFYTNAVVPESNQCNSPGNCQHCN